MSEWGEAGSWEQLPLRNILILQHRSCRTDLGLLTVHGDQKLTLHSPCRECNACEWTGSLQAYLATSCQQISVRCSSHLNCQAIDLPSRHTVCFAILFLCKYYGFRMQKRKIRSRVWSQNTSHMILNYISYTMHFSWLEISWCSDSILGFSFSFHTFFAGKYIANYIFAQRSTCLVKCLG